MKKISLVLAIFFLLLIHSDISYLFRLIGNLSKNIVVDRLNNEMNEFNKALIENNQYSVEMSAKVGGDVTSQKLLVQNSPRYVETEEDGKKFVIGTEGENFYTYIFDDNYVEREYIGKLSFLDTYLEIKGMSTNALTSVSFNVDKFRISGGADTYTIIGKYGDYATNGAFSELRKEFISLGFTTYILDSEIVTTKFSFNENRSVTITNSFILHEESHPQLGIDYNIVISLRIELISFNPIDPFSEEYTISMPDKIEEIRGMTDLSKIKEIDRGTYYYKVELKEGLLIKEKEESCELSLFDEELNLIQTPPKLIPSVFDDVINNLIVVPRDGIYYLELKCKSNNKNLSIINFKYEDIFVEPKTYTQNGEIQLSLEGRYDFEEIHIQTGDDYDSFLIENTGDTPFVIYSSFEKETLIKSGEKKYLSAKRYTDYYYIRQDYRNTEVNQKENYKFEITFFKPNIEKYEEVVSFIGDGYITNTSYSKLTLVHTYLEKGTYCLYGLDHNSISITDSKLEKTINSIFYHKSLDLTEYYTFFNIEEEGEYFIEIEKYTKGYGLKLNKLDYQTLLDLNSPHIPLMGGIENKGIIEGYLDVENYIIKNEESATKSYSFKNTGDEKIVVWIDDQVSPKPILPNDEISFDVESNQNVIIYIANSNIVGKYNPTNYSFTLIEKN